MAKSLRASTPWVRHSLNELQQYLRPRPLHVLVLATLPHIRGTSCTSWKLAAAIRRHDGLSRCSPVDVMVAFAELHLAGFRVYITNVRRYMRWEPRVGEVDLVTVEYEVLQAKFALHGENAYAQCCVGHRD